MFIKVSLVEGFGEFLWYVVPASLQKLITIGSIVRVPLRSREVLAFTEYIHHTIPKVDFEIKPIIDIEYLFGDKYYLSFIQKVSAYYHIPKTFLIRRIKHFLDQKTIQETNIAETPYHAVDLTQEQQQVVESVAQAIDEQKFQSFLLHGVTGSGKTEVYKSLIKQVLDHGNSAIFLVPEVTLAIQFQALLQMHFTQNIVFGFHSATSAAEKKILWKKLEHGQPCLIIGVHLPIFLPISNLRLIIIDEEHEIGYQEKKYPRINSKEAALMRAQVYHIPILLGSATPSISSLYNVTHRKWHLLSLTKRFAGIFPEINIVSLRSPHRTHKEFWFSNELLNALKDRLEKKEQSIIFLNRRGHSFFVQCKQCSFVFSCSSCSVSLTLHENNILKCHYCNYTQPLSLHCTQCNSQELLKKGIGTQQAVKILQKTFPHARIARADLDTTINRKNWQSTIERMHAGDIDILVGTQTITKGYDFKKLTLVGILWADLNLHFPMYNASEISLQQLIQVAGRAGRHQQKSLVIVQSMSEHPIFSYLSEHDYIHFVKKELEHRALCNYPPIIRLAEIELRNMDENILAQESELLAQYLQKLAFGKKITLLGPSSPPVAKIKDIFRKKIYIKARSQEHIDDLLNALDKKQYKSELLFQPNPLS